MEPRMTSTRTPLALISLALALAGCGEPPPVAPDGGPVLRDAAPSPDAAVPPDTERPRVVSMTPDDGSVDVARETAAVLTFSEPIDALGTWRAAADGVALDDVGATLDGTTLTLAPGDGWPAASEVEIRLDVDWRDEAGNELERPFVARFWTDDDVAPAVLSSEPAEGATDVPSRIGAVRILFTERMDGAAGSLRLEGGPGTIEGDPSWTATDVTFGVRGLAHGTAYRVVLDGFRGLDGLALDGAPVIGDGAIDFTTRADDERPRAIASSPFEGQVDVEVVDLGGVIEVRFDEAMDATITTAPITSGTTTASVPITWADPTTARFAVSGVVRLDATTSLDLSGLRDAAGNLVDPVPYLGNGRLDFATGTDAFVPYVVASSPVEGATDVPNPVRDVRLGFSEAMDESLTTVVITGAAVTRSVDGAWTAGGTSLVVPGSAFDPGVAYTVDVRGLRDRSGTPVSDAHGYLGDGRLQFSIAVPTGASCDEPLGIAQATESAPGVYRFDVTAAQRTRDNGSATCDVTGIEGGDAVIRFRKTTPALGSPGGRALRIRTYTASNRANIEVFRDVCDPRSPSASTAMLRCATHHDDWDIELDVPEGEYFIWVSTPVGSATTVPVSIEEVAALQEGQSCERPHDTASSVYTAPATSADPHRWVIPAHGEASLDIADTNAPFAGLSCMAAAEDDVVVTFDKTSADTVLDVLILPAGFFLAAQIVVGGCRPDEPGATRDLCLPSSIPTDGRRLTVRAPAGPVSVWLASNRSGQGIPGATVEIREVPAPAAPGSSCATAIPISPGASVPITPTHAGSYDGPTCFGPPSGVTWYAFESTEQLTYVSADVDGAVAIVNGTTGTQSSCATTVTAGPLHSFAPIGSRVCVAVASGSGISSLAIQQIPYAGAGPTPAVALPIARPSLADTSFTSYGSGWMAVTPTRFYQNTGSFGVIEGALAGTTSFLHLDVDGRSMGQGNAGTAIGESLFSITQTSTSGPRVFRFVDPSGRWAPEVWDRGTVADVYRSGNYRTIGSDGVDLFTVYTLSSSTATPRESEVYRLSGTTPGLPELIGRIGTIYNIDSITADATHLYVNGRTGTSATDTGVFRVARADLAATGSAAPATRLATIASPSQMALDASGYLYVRGSNGTIHVIADAGGTAPRHLGIVFEGISGDQPFGVHRPSGSLYVYSKRWDVEGAWYRLDR